MLTYAIRAGSTDVSVVIRIVDSTDGTPETGVVFNTAGIDLEYRREGAASVDITEATLAALTTAHTDGGFLHIGNGYYRLDLPDAAVASGASGVLVHGTVTGMVVIGCYIQLVAYDPFDAVRQGLTALPNAAAEAAGGLFTRGSGAGQINQSANGQVDVNLERVRNAVVNALISGRLDVSAGALANNVLTAASTAADYVTELQAGLSTLDAAGVRGAVGLAAANLDAQLGAIDDFIDAEIAQLLTDTAALLARLTAARAGYLDNLNIGGAVASQASANAIEADTQDIQTRLPAALASGRMVAFAEVVGDKTGYSLAGEVRIRRNVALANFMFLMVDANEAPLTGLTVTATRSLDGAAFAACANAVAEISNGIYRISLAAGDLDGDVVCLRFTAAGAKDRVITLVTQADL